MNKKKKSKYIGRKLSKDEKIERRRIEKIFESLSIIDGEREKIQRMNVPKDIISIYIEALTESISYVKKCVIDYDFKDIITHSNLLDLKKL